MSNPVVYLTGALIACVVGLVLLWLIHLLSRRRNRREVPFAVQMRALSTDPSKVRRPQPSGIVALDPIDEET